MDDAARERREKRKGWTVLRFESGEDAAMADADAAFWTEIPIDERATLTWQLSLEGYGLLHGDDVQRRLSRSAYRPVRR